MSQIYDPKLSHFDLDMERGRQGELWVHDVSKMLADRSGEIEVKTDYKFPISGNLYIEYEARGRNGRWYKSGIQTTKARIWIFKFGSHPGGLIVEVEWLLKAARLAWKKDEKNRQTMDYGKNPTKGVLIRIDDILKVRDAAKDQHRGPLEFWLP